MGPSDKGPPTAVHGAFMSMGGVVVCMEEKKASDQQNSGFFVNFMPMTSRHSMHCASALPHFFGVWSPARSKFNGSVGTNSFALFRNVSTSL